MKQNAKRITIFFSMFFHPKQFPIMFFFFQIIVFTICFQQFFLSLCFTFLYPTIIVFHKIFDRQFVFHKNFLAHIFSFAQTFPSTKFPFQKMCVCNKVPILFDFCLWIAFTLNAWWADVVLPDGRVSDYYVRFDKSQSTTF